MNAFSCVVQADSVADRSRAELERRLSAHHASHEGNPDVGFTWRTVPEGFMFTEGRQSTSSIISCDVGRATTLAEREAYMRGVCDVWTDVTGCTDHEIVVAITKIEPEKVEPQES